MAPAARYRRRGSSAPASFAAERVRAGADVMSPPDGSLDPTAGYSPEEERPLASYTVLTAVFASAVSGGMLAAHRHRGEWPERVEPLDIVTIGIATHKLSRLITKDKVTAFLRAPFTRFQEATGQGEVAEEPRGEGLRYATGELLICPYCISQWVVGAFGVGIVAAPRFTRLVASLYAAQATSDFLQLAYLAAEERASTD